MAETNQAADASRSRKRKRKIWSCSECRRRKLQCDRTQPTCNRCVKSGQAASCSYEQDNDPHQEVLDVVDQGTPLTMNGPNGLQLGRHDISSLPLRVEIQERRIKELESALSYANAKQLQVLPPTPLSTEHLEQSQHLQDNDNLGETGMFLRGGSFHTQFNGSTHPGAIIAQIDGLSQFTKNSFRKFHALKQARRDARQSKTRRGEGFVKPCVVDDMFTLLPTRQNADDLIESYFSNFDWLYHVVHRESFDGQYRKLWHASSEVPPSFIVLVLLIVAAGYCIASIEAGIDTNEGFRLRDQATKTILSCEYWLHSHLQEFDNITDFQVAFMLVFVKQLDARCYKRTWTHAGAVVRDFMCAGLHKDPDRLKGTTSATDKEMRSRIWAAAAEFELQASFQKGMPAIDWISQSDVPKPCNVFDSELLSCPSVQPRHVFTVSSFLAVSSDSIHLRHHLNKLLNDKDKQLSFPQAKELTERLEELLQAIPKWPGVQGNRSAGLLSLNLLQFKLALHERLLRQGGSAAERRFSQMIMMDAATMMLDIHQRLIADRSFALELLCGDHVRVALAICLVATSVDLQSDSSLARLIVREAPKNMDRAIAMIKEKAIRYGDDQRQLWIPITAESFMKAQENPDDRDRYMQEALERFLPPINKSFEVQGETSTAGINDPSADLLSLQPNLFGSDFFSLDDIAAWTFEDWDPLSCLN